MAEVDPVLDGRTMVWAGHPDQKFVGDIATVISPDEIATVTEAYRRTAGFALAALQRGSSLLDEPYER